MKQNGLFWLVAAGIVTGFAFAVGSSLEARAENRLKAGLSNNGAGVTGTPTTIAPAPGVV